MWRYYKEIYKAWQEGAKIVEVSSECVYLIQLDTTSYIKLLMVLVGTRKSLDRPHSQETTVALEETS